METTEHITEYSCITEATATARTCYTVSNAKLQETDFGGTAVLASVNDVIIAFILSANVWKLCSFPDIKLD